MELQFVLVNLWLGAVSGRHVQVREQLGLMKSQLVPVEFRFGQVNLRHDAVGLFQVQLREHPEQMKSRREQMRSGLFKGIETLSHLVIAPLNQ